MIDIDFDKGLVPAVSQDVKSNEVVMLAYMNKEAFKKTKKTDIAHYYSRSRDEIWKKGETSGNIQKVKEILVDCDADSLLLKIEQEGGACHTGYYSCFYRTIEGEKVSEKVFEPEEVY